MLVFFGTSHRSASFLKQAIDNGLKVDLVISDPPKPVGKKQILTENPAVTVAKENNILFVETGHAPSLQSAIQQFDNLTIGVILDYNKIIPSEIINVFPKGIINIHFSKLPQYRGAAPVQYTILNGDKEAWITYYLINEKVDAGQILTQTSLPLTLTENTEELYQKSITKAAHEINGILEDYLSEKIKPMPQTGAPSSTKKLKLENCQIDWNKSPEEIDRLIRAAYPEPGAWSYVILIPSEVEGEESRRDPSASPQDDATKKRLKIIKSHLENSTLVLDLVQLEGKNPVSWKQFKEGYPNNNLAI